MNEYMEIPKECPSCGGKIEYGRMSDFGLKPYMSGYCYMCQDCGKYIVTHTVDKKKAIGTIADGETKYLRLKCHEIMDTMWESSRQRRYYYMKLAKAMDIPYEKCHFGHMNKEQLQQALEFLKTMPRKDRW